MNPEKPTILFERGVPWETIYPVSTRILAEYFARDGWNVIWLTPPLMPWHFMLRKSGDRQRAIAQYRQGGIFYKNVFAYTPRTLIPFSRRFPLHRPFLASLRWQACFPPVRIILARRGVPAPDVLWLGSYHAGGLRGLFPNTPTVFHVTDAFRYYAATPATCIKFERENYLIADHIVVTAPAIRQLLIEDFNVPISKISVVTHGVDLERFSNLDKYPDPLAECPHPRLIALGNTTKLHFDILEQLACSDEVGCVVIVGPKTERLITMEKRLPKLRLVGAVAPRLVPTYLHYCDVGLVLFGEQMGQVRQYVCPMKLFEYAAAGLPVISTPLPIYEALDVPVTQINTPQDAVEAIRKVLRERELLREAIREFGNRNTWEQRYEDANTIVRKLIEGGKCE